MQISDTQVISPTIVNETRFQYIRDTSNQTPLSTAPTLLVQGAFTGGGSSSGTVVSNQDHYELQNYTSIAHGHHFIKFGGRLRDTLYSSNQNSGFNGAYNFSSLNAYQITQVGLQAGSDSAADSGDGWRRKPVLPHYRTAAFGRLHARRGAVR